MNLEELALHALGSQTPLLILIAFVIPLTSRLARDRSRVVSFILTLIGSTYAAIATSIVLYYTLVVGQPLVYMYGGWPPHFGIVYEVDAFNAVIGVFTAWVMIAIVLYSHWYSRHLDGSPWYYTLLLGLEVGILGCLFTGDAFNLFVMIEVLAVSAYGLVAYHREKAEAVEAAAKYALIGAVSTTVYFMAVVLLYAGFGTVNMALLSDLARKTLLADLRYIALISIAFSLWAFTFKAAIFPNHFWLPDAHPEAPTPVSAALSGLVVNVGVYATARFLYTIFSDNSIVTGYREAVLFALFILGSISGVVGALMMMVQKDIKRLLAYSTISHIGIAFMGISAGFLIGVRDAIRVAMMGAIVHVVSHGVAKALLFMASGVFIDAANSRDLDVMKGVGRVYPLTSISMIIGFLSLAGLLPLLGFYSKLLIALGYLNAGFVLGPVLIIVISVLALPGYMKVVSSAIFGTGGTYTKIEGSRWVEVVLLAMALSLVITGILFIRLAPVFEKATLDLVEGADSYISVALEKIPLELRRWLP